MATTMHISDVAELLSDGRTHFNLSAAPLVEHAIRRNEAKLAANGALVGYTNRTGRSPKDKFIVKDETTANSVAWGAVNAPFEPEKFDALYERVMEHLRGRELFVQDLFCGADPAYRLPVRIVNEYAWHNLFVRQLFLRPSAEELKLHRPEFTVIAAPEFKADPKRDGTNSEVFILLNFTRRTVLIGGTSYAGEMKKSIFSIMNFLLPSRNVFPMHCSANVGHNGVSALFFGLSGTGKTTLSADPSRDLIGDDEHGWSAGGIFNFEGGCYAKCIKLSKKNEPQIWNALRFGCVLENVTLDPHTRAPDYNDDSKTENTRAAYPVDFIDNAVIPGHWRTSEKRGVPHRRRVRRVAAHRAPVSGTGHVSLSLGLHRESGRHRSWSERTFGNILHVLRVAVHAAAAAKLTPRCWAAACANITRSAGSSTPAGKADLTAWAGAWTFPTPAPWSTRPSKENWFAKNSRSSPVSVSAFPKSVMAFLRRC